MYKRRVSSLEAILIDYMRHLAPCDYDELGFSESYLRKASNPHDFRPLCIKRAKKLEAFRAELGQPQNIIAWFNDTEKSNVPETDFKSLIRVIGEAKKEADDVSTKALALLSDGDASLEDLKQMQSETDEAYLKYRHLRDLISQAINEYEVDI